MIREMIREGEEQRVDVDEQQGVSLWSAASSSVITGDVLTEELQCGICIGPAFDPVRSICCRNLFCQRQQQQRQHQQQLFKECGLDPHQ